MKLDSVTSAGPRERKRAGGEPLDAIRDLSAELRSGRYHFLVEADIRSYFDKIDHEKLIELLEKRIDDKPFLRLIRKWLKAGILETNGRVSLGKTGDQVPHVPQEVPGFPGRLSGMVS